MPGKHYAFSVEIDGSKLTWVLTSFQGTKKTSVASSASSSSSRCKASNSIEVTPCHESGLISSASANSLDGSLQQEGEIAVYPNPVGDKLTVNLEKLGDTEVAVTLYDILGRTCLEKVKLRKKGSENELDIADLKPGLYLLKLEYGTKTRQVKIIKQ